MPLVLLLLHLFPLPLVRRSLACASIISLINYSRSSLVGPGRSRVLSEHAVIIGTTGRITLEPAHAPTQLTIVSDQGVDAYPGAYHGVYGELPYHSTVADVQGSAVARVLCVAGHGCQLHACSRFVITSQSRSMRPW